MAELLIRASVQDAALPRRIYGFDGMKPSGPCVSWSTPTFLPQTVGTSRSGLSAEPVFRSRSIRRRFTCRALTAVSAVTHTHRAASTRATWHNPPAPGLPFRLP